MVKTCYEILKNKHHSSKYLLFFYIHVFCIYLEYLHGYLNLFNLKNNILRKLDDHGHFWITDILISFNWRVLNIEKGYVQTLKLEYLISLFTK